MSTLDKVSTPTRPFMWQIPTAVGVLVTVVAATWAAWNSWSLRSELAPENLRAALQDLQVATRELEGRVSRLDEALKGSAKSVADIRSICESGAAAAKISAQDSAKALETAQATASQTKELAAKSDDLGQKFSLSITPVIDRLDALERRAHETEGAIANVSADSQTAAEASTRASADVARAKTITEESAAKIVQLQAQVTRLDTSVGEIGAAAAKLGSRVTEMSGSVSGLGEKVGRLAGQVVLSEPPAELSRAVEEAIETWLPAAKPSDMPSDTSDLRDAIDRLQSSMLNGYRVAYSGQLRRLEWWADVIDLLASRNPDGVMAAARLAEAEELAMGAPSLAPNWAFDQLERYRLALMIRIGQAELAGGADGLPPSPEILDNVRSLLLAVQRSPLAGGFDADIKALKTSLDGIGKRGEERELEDALAMLQELRDKVMKTKDPVLRVQMMSGLDAQAMGLLAPSLGTPQQRLIEAKALPWRKETEALAKQIDDENRRNYQCWALDRIGTFERDVARHMGITDDEAKIREEMERWLLPISEALLEPPVAQKFSQQWARGYNELADPDKKKLLAAVAGTRKLQIGEVTCR